ncbi:YfhE family protein [Virgibacillus alimentarius]|nr:YfhE family protein [Virgibacillus alimentarius]
MRNNSKGNQPEKFLKKTQEVLYQKEFKQADRVYHQFTQRENRS